MSTLVNTSLNNQYFLRRLAGSGATADVYEAWDSTHSTRMAIKVLRRDLASSQQFLQVFAREADMLRSLTHPSIVRLYEFRQDQEVYIVMDWVDGPNLRDYIREKRTPLSLPEVIKVLQPVSAALDFAHKNRIYHCDVKPANILLHVDGRVLITDFGVARLGNERQGGGTPPYMAPEQFSGGSIDARTDVYALGVTLYEVLSGGIAPFRGEDPSSQGQGTTLRDRIVWEHFNLPVPPFHDFNPNCPEMVQQVIAVAMNKNPAGRFTSTLTLLEAFIQAVQGFSVPPAPPIGNTDEGQTVYGHIPPPPPPSEQRNPVSDRPLPPLPPSQHPIQPLQPQQRQPVPVAPPPGMLHNKSKHAPYLYCRSGDFAGQNLFVPEGSTSIGRGSQNMLRLSDSTISRQHALLVRNRTGVVIQDQNSTQGTWVNGQRISVPIRLRQGDVIQLGYYQVFEYREQ